MSIETLAPNGHASQRILVYQTQDEILFEAVPRLSLNASVLRCHNIAEIQSFSTTGDAVEIVVGQYDDAFQEFCLRRSPTVQCLIWDPRRKLSLKQKAELALANVCVVSNQTALATLVERLCVEGHEEPQRRRELIALGEHHGLIGQDPSWIEVLKKIRLISPLHGAPIILTGETGTGKELVARMIHALSRKETFIGINCANLSDTADSQLFGHKRGAFTSALTDHIGFLQKASGGTILLDEIPTLSLLTQAKLLRALQEKVIFPLGATAPVSIDDVQIIVATNQDLQNLVADNQFREDLYYRLNALSIHLPPLRQRRGDITKLARHFLEKYSHLRTSTIRELSPDVTAAFHELTWPGNVRELEHTILDALTFRCTGSTLELTDLPPNLLQSLIVTSSTHETINEMQHKLIKQTLEASDGNVCDTARKLRISKSTVYRKLKKAREA